MLAPYRLFDAILRVIEAKKDDPINQVMIDTLNKSVKRMIDVYVSVYGYARPDFKVLFVPELPDTLVVEALNPIACHIAEVYGEKYAESEEDNGT